MRPRLLRPAAAALAVLAAASGCSDPAPDPGAGTGPAPSSATSPVPTSSSPPPGSRAPAPSPTPVSLPGPYVAAATWADTELGSTLEVAPTPAGRATRGPADAATAWREVLALAPGADAPGMWEQFLCHWTWARILEPGKPTWNVEPWRPVVDEGAMLAEGCNPGGPEV